MMRKQKWASVACAVFVSAAIGCSGGDDGAGGATSGSPNGGNGSSSSNGGSNASSGSNGSSGASASDGGPDSDASASTGTPGAGLHVSGNQILDASGKTVHLLGVNRNGTEYMCIQNNGIFDGPNDAASVDAMVGWKVNAVRVPLNEDCWLSINGVAAKYSGTTYQQAISDYVDLLLSKGIYPILELHWNAPGTTPATGQQPMADSDHAPTLWTQVATKFKDRPNVVFDLYNEPYPDNNSDSTAAWKCWRDGGTCSGVSFPVAGMQTLVDTVRAAGAGNLIMLGGVQYANAMSQWLTYKPTDSANNLAAAWHVYDNNICNSTSCYDTKVGPVASSVPLIASEIGENDCGDAFITTLMGWLDSKNQSYLGFAWDTWGTCLMLISDYAGTSKGTYGATFKAHLAATPH
jgi:endoglucanase